MKTREEVIAMLEAVKVGDGKPIGIGTIFWLEMRWHMLRTDPDLHQYTQANILRLGKVGIWRGHDLYIIPGNLMADGLDDPRPWMGAVG